MLELRLQFFAKEGPGGEKTEEPTSKKLEDARKEGQVAKSREVGNAFMLITLFLLLRIGFTYLYDGFFEVFQVSYNRIPELIKMPGGYVAFNDISRLLRDTLFGIIMLVLPFFVVGSIVAFLSDFIQIKWLVTTKPLKPKMSKISPAGGFKRIFSINSVMELIKSIFKVGLIAYIFYSTIKKQYNVITLLFQMPWMQGVALSCSLAVDLGLKCSFVYLIIAAIDYIYQKRKFKKDMMMTKQEIKDEYKQAEGDPQIKGKIRQKMRESSQQRMMQSVPQADVVITNPTHFAVAIKYDSEVAPAPVVVAKGEDYLAQKIKEAAKENKVEIVENKPLARMLYHNVEIGEQVPPELYQAVAEVLAMVYHMQGKI